jgi:hypothetical protein
MSRRVRLAACVFVVGFVGVVGASAGCVDGSGAPPEQKVPVAATTAPVAVMRISGYPLQGDPKSAVEFDGNEAIFTAEVVGREAPRKYERVTETGDVLEYAYTPILVKIGQIFKGSQLKQDGVVTIRILGGQVGNEKWVSDIAPAPEQFADGMKLVLFTGKFRDADDGMGAATPNFTFVEDGNHVYNLMEPNHRTETTAFLTSISRQVGP